MLCLDKERRSGLVTWTASPLLGRIHRCLPLTAAVLLGREQQFGLVDNRCFCSERRTLLLGEKVFLKQRTGLSLKRERILFATEQRFYKVTCGLGEAENSAFVKEEDFDIRQRRTLFMREQASASHGFGCS